MAYMKIIRLQDYKIINGVYNAQYERFLSFIELVEKVSPETFKRRARLDVRKFVLLIDLARLEYIF